MRKNTVYTKGFVNDDGCIEVPGVFLEDGAKVELAIEVESGRFEVAVMPSEEKSEMPKDCGISDEEIMRCCNEHEDCGDCPLNDYCEEEFAD